MRKEFGLITVLLSLLLMTQAKAQSSLEKKIVGLWTASKIYDMGAVIPEDIKPKIAIMQKMLLGAKYQFKEDHGFSFESSIKEMTIKNAHWKILPDNGDVVIKEWKDKDKAAPLLMKIKVLQRDDKMIFMMEETFFAYEMVKSKDTN